LPGYVYAVKDRNLYVNLFLSNNAELKVAGKDVCLSQTTDYPWNGDITLRIDKNKAGEFWLNIRLPGWVYNQVVPSGLYTYADGKTPKFTVSVNNFQHHFFPSNIESAGGYISMGGKWKKGDVIKIHFDMEPRVVRANDNVEADRGMLCVERGPLVYCAEQPDNKLDVTELRIGAKTKFGKSTAEIAGTTVTTLVSEDGSLTLIPYYAWCHRGGGKMRVWLNE
jgi:hypothetical protein